MTVAKRFFRWPPALGCAAVSLICLSVLLGASSPAAAKKMNAFERCLMGAMETADDATTMGDLRQKCRQETETGAEGDTGQSEVTDTAEAGGALDLRLAKDADNVLEPFTLMAHKPNYILAASYNASGISPSPYQNESDDPTIGVDNTEAKFQISIKTPLAVGLFDDRLDIFAAYTNRSFWQVYNDDQSSPFRDTNHEPEVWLQFRNDWQFWGFTNRVNGFGYVHQSNGRGGSLSRSWNRLYANFIFERKNLAVSLKPWYRIKEDSDDDDNPDITDYLGHGEMRAAYKWNDNTFSLLLRNNLESGFSRGTVELGWSFPLWKYRYFKGYIQYFNGYGESMIDYNEHSNSIGAGFLLTDWL